MKSVVAGAVFVLSVASACERTQPLGDLENRAGTGGDGAGSAARGGSSKGGAAHRGGRGGNAGSLDGGTTGGTTGVDDGGSIDDGGFDGGEMNDGGSIDDGGFDGGTDGGEIDCYSPDAPALALGAEGPGCVCDAEVEASACVGVPVNGNLHQIAMVCENGRWQTVEDGPCEPGPGPACMIRNRIFSERPPPQFLCEWCAHCMNDDPVCTLIDCLAPEPCPAGTIDATRCWGCGPVDNCTLSEHGCFSPCDDTTTCDIGRCSQNVCTWTCP